jgi:hypothetical protein
VTLIDHITQSGEDPDVQRLGIGMRLSIHPHCDDFAGVILGALDDVAQAGLTEGLAIETDVVSTYVGARQKPAERSLAAYASALIAAAHRRGGGHVVAHILLSRGCPGEISCERTHALAERAEDIDLEPTGIAANAQWSLYPLMDGGSTGGDHMAPIMAAIERAKERGVAASPAHYATLLTGDVSEVIATAAEAFLAVGTEVSHVVTHLTVSVGSPSEGASA